MDTESYDTEVATGEEATTETGEEETSSQIYEGDEDPFIATSMQSSKEVLRSILKKNLKKKLI